MTEPDECACDDCQPATIPALCRAGAQLLARLLRDAQPEPRCALVDELLADLDDEAREA